MPRRIIVIAIAAIISHLSGSALAQPAGTEPAVINREDRLQIAITDFPGLGERPLPVESDGTVTLPLIGQLQAEGLTVEQFTNQVTNHAKTYVRTPKVSVKLLAKSDRRIAVGAGFKNPGIHALPEDRTLPGVISAVGGLQSNAGSTIRILRRSEMGAIPLPTAVDDPAAHLSSATVNLSKLMQNGDAMASLVIMPNDVLSAEPANAVYLTGEVLKPGSYDLSDRESVGLTELISMGGGVGRDADPRRARVLRKILNGAKRAEIPVDIVSILNGEAVDFSIQPNDIVEIPRLRTRAGGAKTALRYVVPAAASGLIYTLIRR